MFRNRPIDYTDPVQTIQWIRASRAWSIRALIVCIAAQMVWLGLSIHRTVPADSHLYDYLTGPATTAFGAVMLGMFAFVNNTFVDFGAARPRAMFAMGLGTVAVVALPTLGTTWGHVSGTEMWVNLCILAVLPATLATAFLVSDRYHAMYERELAELTRRIDDAQAPK